MYLLWMELIQSAIHPNGDVQMVQTTVLSDFVYNSGHSCSTDLGSPVGNSSTHFLDDNTVITCAVQAQMLQNGPDLQ